MVKNESKIFLINLCDVNNLLKELAKWNLTPDSDRDDIAFEFQSNNIVYSVYIKVIENFEEQDRQFVEMSYQKIKTFDDIQNKIFGRVIWNWK